MSEGLTGRQRKFLRGEAHSLQPIVQIGVNGITDSVVAEVDRALATRELIKVRMHEPEDKKAMAHELADRTSSSLCGLVGHTAILYRVDPEEPKIQLPD